MKAFKITICLLLFLNLISCSKMDKSQIIGNYGIDKGVLRDANVKIEEYTTLSLNEDNTFQLRNYKDEVKVNGQWEVIENMNKEEVLIKFHYSNKQITALLKGTIFTFEYPNDFYDGRYRHLIYVKLSNN
ncbi:hypothetical protein ACLI08_07835 [Flavobacterium sp. RNTU_13]|uniref:hypothetical protein n=1 Tax=Flavobacterium sp. RNTU_13 TaxID=3375145 RepID=UPI0039871102